MAKRTCSIADCDKTSRARGWCTNHYEQWRRYGDPLGVYEHDPIARFWLRVDKTDTCWNWTGPLKRGYGQHWTGSAMVSPHRLCYELTKGAVPNGFDVDHICRNRRCVNPDHLRATTRKQNIENHSGAGTRSKSGVRGVYPCKQTGRWIAFVGHHGKNYNIGRFGTIEEAEAAVVAKRNELFTHNDLDRGESGA